VFVLFVESKYIKTFGASGHRIDRFSCHVGFVVNKHRVRGFSREFPVSSHFIPPIHHSSGQSQSCLKALKLNSNIRKHLAPAFINPEF